MKNSNKKSAKTKKEDIIDLILQDHKPLKKFIKIMKDTKQSESARRDAFEQFAPLLMTHAKPEAEVLYTEMKGDEEALRVDGYEGEVEHDLAELMLKEIKATTNSDIWTAKVKVLAEIVEHHIQEEEDDVLPDFRKASEKELRIELGEKFLQAKENYQDWSCDDIIEPISTKSRNKKGFEPIHHQ